MAADTGRGAGNWVFLSITNEQRPAHPRATIDAATHTPSSCHTFLCIFIYFSYLFFRNTLHELCGSKMCFSGKPVRGKKLIFLKGKRTLCLRLDKYLSKFSMLPWCCVAEGFFFLYIRRAFRLSGGHMSR